MYTKNLEENDLFDLLELCFDNSQYFSLSRFNDIEISRRCICLLEMLSSYLIKSEITHFNEVTVGPVLENYYYKCNSETLNIIKLALHNIYELSQPLLLEDISFYHDHNAWFRLNSHERYYVIEPYSQEIEEKIARLQALYW